jgi:hypothetical protein
MAKPIEGPTVVESGGDLPKRIEEFVGRRDTGTTGVGIPAFSPETVRRDT